MYSAYKVRNSSPLWVQPSTYLVTSTWCGSSDVLRKTTNTVTIRTSNQFNLCSVLVNRRSPLTTIGNRAFPVAEKADSGTAKHATSHQLLLSLFSYMRMHSPSRLACSEGRQPLHSSDELLQCPLSYDSTINTAPRIIIIIIIIIMMLLLLDISRYFSGCSQISLSNVHCGM